MLDIRRIEALARTLEGTPVTELVVVERDTEIRFARTPTLAPAQEVHPSPPIEEAPRPREHLVLARRVGIYHRAQPPVQQGERVEAGDVVGYIEAMRIPNEVIVEHTGTITQCFAEDGAPVEYGQELFLLVESEDEPANESNDLQ